MTECWPNLMPLGCVVAKPVAPRPFPPLPPSPQAPHGGLLLTPLSSLPSILLPPLRLPEAAFFSRTYLPSKISEVTKVWKADLERQNPKAAEALADPDEYPNLFPDLEWALKVRERGEGDCEGDRKGGHGGGGKAYSEGMEGKIVTAVLRVPLLNIHPSHLRRLSSTQRLPCSRHTPPGCTCS